MNHLSASLCWVILEKLPSRRDRRVEFIHASVVGRDVQRRKPLALYGRVKREDRRERREE